MANPSNITRRSVLASVPAMGAAAIIPASAEPISANLSSVFRSGAKTIDDQLTELADRFKHDAMAIDPTIKGIWLGSDLTFVGRRAAVQAIIFERENASFVRNIKS